MKSEKSSKIALYAILLFNSLIITSSKLSDIIDYDFNNNSQKITEESIKLKSSSHWTVPYIHINNNWTAVNMAYDWCNYKNGYYIIENVSITGVSGRNGIQIENTTENFLIKNCQVNEGIVLKEVQSGQILNNNITFGTIQYLTGLDNKIGIYMDSCSNITIKSNIVNDPYNPRFINTYAIFLRYSNNTILKNNFLSTNSSPFHMWGHYGIRISGKKDNHKIEVINNTIRDSDEGISLSGCDSSQIINNTIRDNYFGIDVVYSDSCRIVNNNVCCKGRGLEVRGNNYIIANNSIKSIEKGFLFGIYAYCSNSTFSYNSIQNENEYGFYFISSSYNNITYNNIEDSSEYGIEMKNSDHNNITHNIIQRSGKHGIYLIRTNNSIITNNFINSRSKCIKEINCYGNIISDNICQQITIFISGYFPWIILGILFISMSILLKFKSKRYGQ